VKKGPLSHFHEPVRRWFEDSLGQPTRIQALGWGPIAAGESTLLLAPTGSGKTLAAFLAAIEKLMWSAPIAAPKGRGTPGSSISPGVRVLYVSPLKALAVDVEKNLRAPLAGVLHVAQSMGVAVRTPTVQVRTGDTPQAERARMLRHPPDILITTPESLYLMLTSNARETLAAVETVIVDEIHSLVASKRGAHLFLSLERLEALRRRSKAKIKPLQRIGLSATQRPLDEVARLLGGFEKKKPRKVLIVDAGEKKSLDLRVETPDIDMAKLGEIEEVVSGPAAGSGARRSIWPSVQEKLVGLIRAHRSTMVFVNSRRLAERLATALNELAGEEIALAHHGSVAREKRAQIEDRLKQGTLPAIVATSSLELGIDMGAVDLVVQIEAPPSIASGLQRVGRGGHNVGDTSKGILVPKHRGDLVACAAAISCMERGEVEETFYPRSPLDVLAQQIVAIAGSAPVPIDVEALFTLVRGAAPFAELPRGAFESVLDMLSGRYPSDDFAELRARVTWDRVGGTLRAREGALRLAIANGGTIPDRGLYGVFLSSSASDDSRTSKRVGELDEEMVFELREGEVFLLGASSWRADTISLDRVLVSPAPGEPGKMPFWHGDRPGRSRAFGTAIGELSRKITRGTRAAGEKILARDHHLDAAAARNCVAYLFEQLEASGELPSDRAIVVERFLDEIGDWRVCVLSPFGARVHAPWATAVLARLREAHGGEADAVWSDDGMAFRLTGTLEPPATELFLPASDEVEMMVTASLAQTSLFAARFRECAARALLLPRRHPTKRTPLWAQRKRASDLLSVASQYPSFPMVLETYRECLRDVFDLSGLVDLLAQIESRRMRVLTVDSQKPSPFAASLLFAFAGNFIYDSDAPLAEKRAQALTIDHAQLRELLGDAEMRELLDPELIAEHERTLQRLTHPARHADGVHDLLLSIGDLTIEELRERTTEPEAALAWVKALEAERRIFKAKIAGDERYVASEDAGRFRDALGVTPPRGLPEIFLEATKGERGSLGNPLGDLVARYARTHGPFTASDVARRFGLGVATAADVLDRFVRAGRIHEGAFLASGRSREYCEKEVLRVIRRKSLAKLRKAVEPVDGDALGRFLLEWQGVTRKRRGPDALLAVIAQLEGCPLPMSALESEILPARIEGYRPWDLDALCAAGEVVWAGVESIGPSDGRIALYLADHEALLSPAQTPAEGEIAEKIRALLARRGAVFFAEIVREVGGFGGEVVDALWDLVWCGEVTNDTCEPLRSFLRARDRTTTRLRGRRGAPPGTEGRWSLRASRWFQKPTETERRTALARSLLDRYGLVTREAAHAEGIVGGFSAVYEILKAMEEAGRIRRGYFLAGRGATQFALPGADDRIRSMRAGDDEPKTVVLAATDPANPYGAALPWPAVTVVATEDTARARPQRAAGSRVVLHDGAVIGYLGRSTDSLLTFLPTEEPARGIAEHALAEALASIVESGRRKALLISAIDGAPAPESTLANALTRAGFHLVSRGFFRRRRVPGAEDGLAHA
jgi:ATP-dependent Lhr-like helicase